MGCGTASCTAKGGWLTGLMQARFRSEESDRDTIEAYECTGCGVMYARGESEKMDSEAQHRAMSCCAKTWRRLKRRGADEVRRWGYRKLARGVTAYICPHCEDVLDGEYDECQCDRQFGEVTLRECPLCRQRPGLTENGVGAVVDCCLWQVAGHARRTLVKERICGGADAVSEFVAALVDCGVLSQSDSTAMGV
jgi:hypothetical protein